MIRSILHLAGAAGLLLGASQAWAGGGGCAHCYRHVVQPAVYGAVAERVMVRAPRAYTTVIPGRFEVVPQQVMVSPARKVWQVTRDAYGNTVGCWVTVPAQYAVQYRTVLVRPPQRLQHYQAAEYAVHHRAVLVQPARAGWVPASGYPSHGYGHGAASYGYGAASYGYGAGFSGYGAGAALGTVAGGALGGPVGAAIGAGIGAGLEEGL